MAKTTYAMVKAWRKKNPEKWKAQVRAYYKRRNATVVARRKRYNDKHRKELKAKRLIVKRGISLYIDGYKVSMGCIFCAENFPAALDFHHIGDKEANVSQIALRSWSLDRVKAEMDKCILMCANCHRKLHAGFLSLD